MGRVTLAPAGLCAMHGQAELIDTAGATRQADCVIMLVGKTGLSATCR